MPMKCCVPGCRSNSTVSGGYVKVFIVPKNPIRRNAWLENIPRENWTPNRNSVVCIKHFKEEDIVMGKHWKLTPDAVPTIFPDASCAPKRKAKKKSSSNVLLQNTLESESVGNFGADVNCLGIVYCEVEDAVENREEPSNIDDATDMYQNSEEPTSCGDSAPAVEYSSASQTDTERFEVLGKYWAEKMKLLGKEQRIFAEKLINDVLSEAELGRLSHECYITN